jgi:hypothetical protein
MRVIRIIALVSAIFLSGRLANAQGLPTLPLGGYYINCPYSLNNIAFDYSLLEYQGHFWNSTWRASVAAFPLPPRTWYVPVGTSTLVSTDGQAKWLDPQVEVLCWIYNALDVVSTHDDPIRFSGSVVQCGSSTGGGNVGGTSFTDIGMDPGYDPYGTFDSDGGGSCGTGTSGDSGGGGFVCHTEYVYIEISYDGGVTWDGWWEGYATVCDS